MERLFEEAPGFGIVAHVAVDSAEVVKGVDIARVLRDQFLCFIQRGGDVAFFKEYAAQFEASFFVLGFDIENLAKVSRPSDDFGNPALARLCGKI